MANSIRMNAKLKGGVTTVKILIKHPMETGSRKNKETGKTFPAHFIQEITCEHNGKPVLNGYWGVGVSTNPYLSFRLKGGGKGDSIKFSWVDNKGGAGSNQTKIK